MDKTEKRISLYSSLLIGLLMCSPKFMALRGQGIIAHFWHFNLAEFIIQVAFNVGFCYLLFYLNLRNPKAGLTVESVKKQTGWYLFNAILLLVSCLLCGVIQRQLFMSDQPRGIYWTGYLSRFFLSTLFAGVLIKIILLMRVSRQKDKENSQLKTAYLEAELGLLKEQLNPHFLFNSLSSLSGIVREDPEMAQHFINHLSKIFRYALAAQHDHLVSITEELTMIKSYEQLLKMRFEKAFLLETNIEKHYLHHSIPHLSLQPLLENAAKHNSASIKKPLKVYIYIEDDYLVVKNDLQEIAEPENSTGIGLANLNSRFRILMHKDIEIEKTKDSFIVKLPLTK
ncbi:MAG: histidine kinase [Mucilaginibacter sp.]|nr:histidine kinase [Mucilaginibacter sp.]